MAPSAILPRRSTLSSYGWPGRPRDKGARCAFLARFTNSRRELAPSQPDGLIAVPWGGHAGSRYMPSRVSAAPWVSARPIPGDVAVGSLATLLRMPLRPTTIHRPRLHESEPGALLDQGGRPRHPPWLRRQSGSHRAYRDGGSTQFLRGRADSRHRARR